MDEKNKPALALKHLDVRIGTWDLKGRTLDSQLVGDPRQTSRKPLKIHTMQL